jgi:hypothetical protein
MRYKKKEIIGREKGSMTAIVFFDACRLDGG